MIFDVATCCTSFPRRSDLKAFFAPTSHTLHQPPSFAMAETTNTPAPVTPQRPPPFKIELFSYPKALPKKTAETAHSVTRGISQLRMVAETGQDIPPSIKEELALAEEHFATAARRLIRLAKQRAKPCFDAFQKLSLHRPRQHGIGVPSAKSSYPNRVEAAWHIQTAIANDRYPRGRTLANHCTICRHNPCATSKMELVGR